MTCAGKVSFESRYQAEIEAKKMRTTTNAWLAYSESQCFHPVRVHTTCFFPQYKFQDILQVNGLSAVNTWRPPEVRRKKGSAAIFEDLIHTMFPVERDSKILLSYFAACVQYPGVKFDWAVYLQGVLLLSGGMGCVALPSGNFGCFIYPKFKTA